LRISGSSRIEPQRVGRIASRLRRLPCELL
jgi:hypothetical protein